MAETNTEMNLEKAREIIASGVPGTDYDNALQFLRLYYPEDPILTEHSETDENIARINSRIDEVVDAMNQDKDERAVLGEENHDLESDEDVAKNLRNISDIFEDDIFKRNVNLKVIRDTSNIEIASGSNILGKGDGKEPELVEAEEDLRKKFLDELLEAAKHEVLMFYGQDGKFASYDKDQQRKILEDSVIEVFNFKVERTVAASAIRKPTEKEGDPDSKEGKDYQQQVLDDMRDALETYYKKDINSPARINTHSILTSVVKTSISMDDHEEKMRDVKLTGAANYFNEKKEDYNQKRRGFWGKAFDVVKKNVVNMLKGVKENWMHIATDAVVVTGATVGASIGALTAPITAPIVAAAVMAGYFAGGAFGWQIHDERRNMQKRSKKKVSLREARQNIMADEKKRRAYYKKGKIGAIAGVIGAGLFGVAASSVGLVAGRLASGVARSAGSVASQGAMWRDANKDFEQNATKENKAALDNAKSNFWFSATAAVVTNTVLAYFGLDNAAAGAEATHAGQSLASSTDSIAKDSIFTHGNDSIVKDSTFTNNNDSIVKDSIFTNNNDSIVKDSTFTNNNDSIVKGSIFTHNNDSIAPHGAEQAGQPVVDPTPTAASTPVEWQGDISAKQWNTLTRDVTGIYKDHAAIFGKENVLPEDAMNNAYANIDKARAAGFFQGQSNEDVLYKYVQSVKFTERAELLKGTNYLVTKLDSDGLPMYWHNSEEMNALTRIIVCGEKVDISADRLGDTLALIDKNGQYTGEGADIGVTNNQYVGGTYDCDEYQNAWRKNSFAVVHGRGKIPVTTETPNVGAEEISNNQVTNTEAPQVSENLKNVVTQQTQPQGKTITFGTETYTTGDNYAGSGTGSHAPHTGDTGFAPKAAALAAMKDAGIIK